MRVLLVEDDVLLGKATQAGLRTAFAVDWLTNAEDAEAAVRAQAYDLLVLDINLPGESGLALLKRLRSGDNLTPCLFLTARDAVYHRIEGLNAGADDYLVKPFDLDELLARCAALIRRAHGRAVPVIRHGDLSLDPLAKTVHVGASPVSLSAREFAIAEYLLSHAGQVVSRQQIETAIYDWGSDDIGSNTVEVHISALRRKLGKDFVRTIRNIGYVVET
ncbi:MAG TPA: response regulator transcription factor [Alphaproteobacteria bacterium]|nr:response regulator transcription factor [Alphaproteobacteria bacterium]